MKSAVLLLMLLCGVVAGATCSAADTNSGTLRPGNVQMANLAESMCSAYQPAVANAIGYAQQGIPRSTAEDTVESALSTDPRLWDFLIQSIEVAYRNPQGLTQALQDGTWLRLCVQYLM